jgi:acyl carrier protein
MTSDYGRASDNGHRNEFVIYMIEAGVIGLDNHPNKEKFINESQDIPLAELHVDSLTYIQIAIQIEEKYGLSLSPDEISEFTTLNGLLEVIQGQI